MSGPSRIASRGACTPLKWCEPSSVFLAFRPTARDCSRCVCSSPVLSAKLLAPCQGEEVGVPQGDNGALRGSVRFLGEVTGGWTTMLLTNDKAKPEDSLGRQSITACQSFKQRDRLGLLRRLPKLDASLRRNTITNNTGSAAAGTRRHRSRQLYWSKVPQGALEWARRRRSCSSREQLNTYAGISVDTHAASFTSTPSSSPQASLASTAYPAEAVACSLGGIHQAFQKGARALP